MENFRINDILGDDKFGKDAVEILLNRCNDDFMSLISFMKEKNIREVRYSFSGSGDSGDMDDVISYPLVVSSDDNEYALSSELMNLSDVAMYMSSHAYGGWENDDGAEGVITFVLENEVLTSFATVHINIKTEEPDDDVVIQNKYISDDFKTKLNEFLKENNLNENSDFIINCSYWGSYDDYDVHASSIYFTNEDLKSKSDDIQNNSSEFQELIQMLMVEMENTDEHEYWYSEYGGVGEVTYDSTKKEILISHSNTVLEQETEYDGEVFHMQEDELNSLIILNNSSSVFGCKHP